MNNPKLLSRDDYYEQRKTLNPDICMLCDMDQIVLHEGNSWTWVAALAPYWKYHTMLVPNRHISKISELSNDEWAEFEKLHEKIINLYKNSGLVHNKDTPLQNVLVFWRQRFELYNPLLGANNVDHLHIHFVCDREHFLDPISDKEASTWDTSVFRDEL